MDVSRNDMLGELASDAALERTDFVVQATEQLAQVPGPQPRPDRAAGRPDPDRRRPRLPVDRARLHVPRAQPVRGSRHRRVGRRDTEIVETASELIELYNPAEVYAAFAEAAREAAGLRRRAHGDRRAARRPPASRPRRPFGLGVDDGVRRRRRRSGPPASRRSLEADDEESRRARAVQPRARLPGAEPGRTRPASSTSSRRPSRALSGTLGDLIIVDDDDERLVLGGTGRFRAEVLPEDGDGEWRQLTEPEEIVEFYDPTDIFGDLADALAEAFPAIAPELEDEDEGEDEDEDEGEDEPKTSRTSRPTATRRRRRRP